MFKFTSHFLLCIIGFSVFAGSVLAAPLDIATEGGDGYQPPLAADEMIGTLPTYWTEEELPKFTTNDQDPKTQKMSGLSTEFLVPSGLEQTLIEAAVGDGFALVGPGDWTTDGQERVRIRIFGSVRLRMNKALAGDSSVETSLNLGSAFENSWLTSSFDGELSKIFHSGVTGPSLALGFSNPTIMSLYADKLFQLSAVSSTGSTGLLALSVKDDTIHIRMDS